MARASTGLCKSGSRQHQQTLDQVRLEFQLTLRWSTNIESLKHCSMKSKPFVVM